MSTPFSKGNLGATPSHPTSSPHPSAVPMNRPLSHKSPSIKTPSASGPGNQTHPNTSSHQYPTPLPATTTALDDAAAFSSPSALLALGLSGITPSPAANDALGPQGISESDIHAIGIPSLRMSGPHDVEEERKKNINEVVQILRTKVEGRGVCREAVERVAKLEGLECMWQENVLTIAGNCVDLEIGFEPHREAVKTVILRYATPDAAVGERRVEASEVLERNLRLTPEEEKTRFWKPMTGFHQNLQRLATMDKLSKEINCFEAIEGLYSCFKRLWDEEEIHGYQKGGLDHLCKGWVGRPFMHHGKYFGLILQYWVERRRLFEYKQASRNDEMDLDQPEVDESKGTAKNHQFWNMTIECEAGYPSLRVSKHWVESDLFTNIQHEEGSEHQPGIKVINWAEPPENLVSPLSNNPESVPLEPTILSATTPNVRFVARFDPPIHIPVSAAAELCRISGVEMMQEFKATTYGSLVVTPKGGNSGSEHRGHEILHKRKVSTPDDDGKLIKKQHSYTFNVFEQVAGRSVQELPFSHPRQIALALPILRQYAFLESILKKTFERGLKSVPEESAAEEELEVYTESRPGGYYMSNVNIAESRLDALLRGESTTATTSNGFRVDITLVTPMAWPPSILIDFESTDIYFGMPGAPQDYLFKVLVGVEIGVNGDISVPRLEGLFPDFRDKEEEQQLRTDIAKALETSEDLGILVEWILTWARKRCGR